MANDNHRRACLLIHGFSGGTFEVEPLAEYLRTKGWICHVPTLPGHDNNLKHLKYTHHHQWIETVKKEAEIMTERYQQFDLIGFSMGGMLAAYISNRFPVKKLVLLNAAVFYVSPGRFIKLTYNQLRNKDWSRFKKMNGVPISATWQFVQLAHRLRVEFKKIQTPTLIIQGEQDHIVHPYSARYLSRMIPAKKTVEYFPLSNHGICIGEEADDVFKTVGGFLLQ
ncbi:alpha/beta hydrolase [Chengkuizengella axinellae]|uniref:Alpha/beta fold hydrolase n=1 Tax=Chengkuizengella axinellae TaxID=3064388 RepID=A0ABT9IX82_9BACL|nr:alpha/beta fold hydrolase [Chengkuizengella sp. 2205SS18-9]MDP5273979.1 alpha/beta fold hydrolase [Chengkuizengella sp. 2205SS18-9]